MNEQQVVKRGRWRSLAVASIFFTPVPAQVGIGNLQALERSSSERVVAVADLPTKLPDELRSNQLSIEERKRLFVTSIMPLVERENRRLGSRRQRMLGVLARLEKGNALPPAEQQWLRSLAEEYKIKIDPLSEARAREELKRRLDIIPVDLALAQAALESGWGRSKYARIHRDVFGMSGIVRKNPSKPKFASLAESVHTYVHTLNTHGAYKQLRRIRENLRAQGAPIEGGVLASGLTRYSVLGKEYVQRVVAVMRSNDFAGYSAEQVATDERHRDRLRANRV